MFKPFLLLAKQKFRQRRRKWRLLPTTSDKIPWDPTLAHVPKSTHTIVSVLAASWLHGGLVPQQELRSVAKGMIKCCKDTSFQWFSTMTLIMPCTNLNLTMFGSRGMVE